MKIIFLCFTMLFYAIFWLLLYRQYKEILSLKVQIKQYNKIVEKQSQVKDWVPVKDRLPSVEEFQKNDGRFIVTDRNKVYQDWFDIYTGVFMREGFSGILSEDICVFAWQPLPEPYKESRKKD